MSKRSDTSAKTEGGMRTLGYATVITPGKPLVSVITVVLNGGQNIESTIKSVLSQDYENIEYLIIDGGSHDETIEIIKKYEEKIDYWISEKDKGLSDALNKGASLATGTSLLYMNCGDSFYSCTTVSKLLHLAAYDQNSVVYGNAKVGELIINTDHRGILDSSMFQNPICHQAAFIPADLQSKYPYDLRYSYSMDLEFWHRLIHIEKASFKKVDLVVCNYLLGGLTSKSSNAENVVYEHWLVKQSFCKTEEKYRSLMRLSKKLMSLRIKAVLRNLVGEETYGVLKRLGPGSI